MVIKIFTLNAARAAWGGIQCQNQNLKHTYFTCQSSVEFPAKKTLDPVTRNLIEIWKRNPAWLEGVNIGL